MDRRYRVVVCGEKWVAEQCLEFLYQHQDTEICALVTAPKDWQADLSTWGVARRLKVYVGYANDYLDELTFLQPDFLFSIQYRSLLRPRLLRLPTRGCVNLHFSMLPRYGGCYPVAWAILNGEQQTRVTLHYMTERFDEGDVLAQAVVPIGSNATARDLFDALSTAAVSLFTDTYPALCSGAVEARPQDLSQRLYYGQDSLDFERARRIDWQQPGAVIQRQVRAFSFEPFQHPTSVLQLPDGRQVTVTVTRTRQLDGRPDQDVALRAGRVIDVTRAGLVTVATGSGEVLEIGCLGNRLPGDFLALLGCAPQDVLFT